MIPAFLRNPPFENVPEIVLPKGRGTHRYVQVQVPDYSGILGDQKTHFMRFAQQNRSTTGELFGQTLRELGLGFSKSKDSKGREGPQACGSEYFVTSKNHQGVVFGQYRLVSAGRVDVDKKKEFTVYRFALEDDEEYNYLSRCFSLDSLTSTRQNPLFTRRSRIEIVEHL